MAAPEALELAESVPHALPAQPAPDRLQFTPFVSESLLTVAAKEADLPVWTVALCGDTPTETGAERVIAAAPVLVLSATDLAVRVTEAGLGSAIGAA